MQISYNDNVLPPQTQAKIFVFAEVFFRRYTFIIIIAGKAYKILNE